MNDEKINILIIDNNKGDVRLNEEQIDDLRNNSFTMIHAETLSEGIELYGKMKFDIILLDLSLPDSIGQKTIFRKMRIKLINSIKRKKILEINMYSVYCCSKNIRTLKIQDFFNYKFQNFNFML